MAKKKSAAKTAAIDVTAGQSAYALAVEYSAQLSRASPPARSPTSPPTSTTLGFPPPAPTPAPTPSPRPRRPRPPPTLAVALSNAENLVSAIQAAVLAGTKSRSVRKEYGAGSVHRPRR